MNEKKVIRRTLDSLRDISNSQIIIVDGGSCDGSDKIIAEYKVQYVSSSCGRGIQLSTGARYADGDILLFLHADTILPSGFGDVIRKVFTNNNIVGGAFAFKVDAPQLKFRLLEKAVAIRSKILKLPYGDQAIFVRKDIFDKIDGFPDQPIMEDFEFVRKMRKKGRLALLSLPAYTSARRWIRLGIIKSTFINQCIICAYLFGCSPARLAKWYGKNSNGNHE